MNPNLEGIAKIKSIAWNEGCLRLVFTLDGLDDIKIEAECKHIEISSDCKTITLGDFSSSMPFVENALNRFAAGTFNLPEGGTASVVIMAIKKTLEI